MPAGSPKKIYFCGNYIDRMNNRTGKLIYRKVKGKQIKLSHVCEVGVYKPETSNIIDFITTDRVRTTLVEPDPKSIEAIRQFFGGYNNVTLLPYAAYEYDGTLELVQRDASTFVAALPYSPAQVNDHYDIRKEDTFSVPCRRFDSIDDGSIDLLSVDTEGSEWYVIKYLKSRPTIISIETHGKVYLNPYIREITAWMNSNGYERWFMDQSDTVYYKSGTLKPSALEKLQIFYKEFRIGFRRGRKKLGRAIFGGNK
jgi:FkbM family methyltransferase